MIDYHTHHVRCGHAIGSLEEYVLRGIEIGLSQLGLSDHMPLIHVDPATYLPEMAMPMDELPRYVSECFELKEKYKSQIDIRVGLEGDYIEGYEETIEKITTGYPWDYVIGSVHFLGRWDISDARQLAGWDGKDVYSVYEQYYAAVQQAARSGLYDYLGHIDVIKRFKRRPDCDVTHLEDQTLQVIRDSNMAIELNASGYRMPCEELFPSERMVKKAFELGIPVTVGSDAHRPDFLSQHLEKAYAVLHKTGYTQLATFDKRKRVMIPIGEEL